VAFAAPPALALIAPSRQVSTPALGLRLDGYHYENPPEKKSCLRWVRTNRDPVPVSILKGLKVGVISDVVRDVCWWKRRGWVEREIISLYFGTFCLCSCVRIVQMVKGGMRCTMVVCQCSIEPGCESHNSSWFVTVS